MPIWDNATIQRFSNEAEDIFAREFPCIIDRSAIAIVANTHTYTLADYIIDVRKITWKGKRIDPLSQRKLREAQIGLTSTSAEATDYIFDNTGASQIRFFPIPTVNIAAISTNLWGTEIPNRVIVEYYRTPDYNTFKIPAFFRRRLLKAYVLKSCFAIEGKGKNLKAAKYWTSKWNYYKETYGQLLEELINSPRHIIAGQTNPTRDQYISRPVLPYDKIGIGVDTGE